VDDNGDDAAGEDDSCGYAYSQSEKCYWNSAFGGLRLNPRCRDDPMGDGSLNSHNGTPF